MTQVVTPSQAYQALLRAERPIGPDWGPYWRSSRPPNLPAYIPKPGPPDSGIPFIRLAVRAVNLPDSAVVHFVALAWNETGGSLQVGLPSNVGGGAASWGLFQWNRTAWRFYFERAATTSRLVQPDFLGDPSRREAPTLLCEVGLTTLIYGLWYRYFADRASDQNERDLWAGYAMRVYHRRPVPLKRAVERYGRVDASVLRAADSGFDTVRRRHDSQLSRAEGKLT